MPNPVVHFQITGHDPAALVRFYGSVFGWRITSLPEVDYMLIDTEAGGINGGIALVPPGQPGYVCLYTEVDAPDAMLAQIAGSGGKVLVPVTAVPKLGVVAMYADPEGHPMGLVQAMPDYSHHEYRVYDWPPPTTEGAVVHFEITGRNLDALRPFYRNVFGWHADTTDNPDYAPIDTHTICISGAIGLQERDRDPVTVFIQTADIAGTLARIETAGGHTVETHPPTFALFADPEGHILGLIAEEEQPSP